MDFIHEKYADRFQALQTPRGRDRVTPRQRVHQQQGRERTAIRKTLSLVWAVPEINVTSRLPPRDSGLSLLFLNLKILNTRCGFPG